VLSPKNLDFVPLTWLPYVDIVGREPDQLILFHGATRSTIALLSLGYQDSRRRSYGSDPSGPA
jgi:hypothetical protein